MQMQQMYYLSFFSCSMSLLGGVLFEYAVEMTYPLPESVSAGLVNFSFQVRALMIIINCLLRHENISLIKPL